MATNDLVLYHANCNDGFCAAWIAWKEVPDAEFRPVQYGQEPPDVAGRNVLILDFSYPRPVLMEMQRQARSLLVLDHHRTAQAELEGLDFCRFDMNKSGARMTWEYFHGDAPSPWLVDYTEDRDLWRWARPASRVINAALASHPRTFPEWEVSSRDPGSRSRFIRDGSAILRYQAQLIEAIAANAREVEIDGHKVLCANSSVLCSEVAGKLAEGRPFGACWFETAEGTRVYSLRSGEKGVDVSEIARRHGGGGHRHAAGFRVGPEATDQPLTYVILGRDRLGAWKVLQGPKDPQSCTEISFSAWGK